MSVHVETLDKLERRITLTLPAASIASEVESRLRRLSRTVRADGFRPGKVPMSVVAQRYGYSVQSEVLNDKVGKVFNEAVSEAKLRVAGPPRITEKPEAPEGEVAFDATFEVYPEIQLGDLSQTEVERVSASVTDEAVDKTIEILRKQRRTFQQRPQAEGAAEGDRVTIDFAGSVDGARKIDGDAIARRCTFARRPLLERAPLFPQDLDRLVDRLVGDLGRDALDLGLREIAELHLGIDLEGRVEGDLTLGCLRLLGDARRPRDAQLGLVDRLREDLADLVVEHFAVDRIAVALRDDAHRHLAGAKAVGANRAREAAQPGLDLRRDRRRRQREGDAPLELVERFNLDGHGAFGYR